VIQASELTGVSGCRLLADGGTPCHRRRRVALVLATIWLSGYAMGASDGGALRIRTPVVEYNRQFQARAAEELTLQPPILCFGVQN
jgi:hypothetical protein